MPRCRRRSGPCSTWSTPSPPDTCLSYGDVAALSGAGLGPPRRTGAGRVRPRGSLASRRVGRRRHCHPRQLGPARLLRAEGVQRRGPGPSTWTGRTRDRWRRLGAGDARLPPTSRGWGDHRAPRVCANGASTSIATGAPSPGCCGRRSGPRGPGPWCLSAMAPATPRASPMSCPWRAASSATTSSRPPPSTVRSTVTAASTVGVDGAVMFLEFAQAWANDPDVTGDMAADWRATIDALQDLPEVGGGRSGGGGCRWAPSSACLWWPPMRG